MEAFSTNWFTMYYLGLGILFLAAGFWQIISYPKAKQYLLEEAEKEEPPVAIRNILKYFFFFTIPCLILSFLPFSLTELLFSIWSLFIVYFTGIQLVRWKQSRLIIKQNPEKLDVYIRITGAIMVAVSLVIFTLSYLVIK